jgi:acetoin utilization protein AcuB
MNYLLGRLAVKEIMTRRVITVTEDTPLEEAARVMVDNKIGGLPVIRDGHVVGIITETDLFKVFLELLGGREAGVRVTLLLAERKGELARLTQAIYQAGGNIVALGTSLGEDPSNRQVTVKVAEIQREALEEAIRPVALKIIDVRGGL